MKHKQRPATATLDLGDIPIFAFQVREAGVYVIDIREGMTTITVQKYEEGTSLGPKAKESK